MDRKETTSFLSDLLVRDRLGRRGKYYAKEVSLDYGTVDVRRIDFLEFVPAGTIYISDIEKGHFIAYEVKSCLADYRSGYGQNFIAEKNYYVMTIDLYKQLATEIPHDLGVICPVPDGRDKLDEFEQPTPIDQSGITWTIKVIKPAITIRRKRSMIELLFCMLRSGQE